jgi:hypothetical protein
VFGGFEGQGRGVQTWLQTGVLILVLTVAFYAVRCAYRPSRQYLLGRDADHERWERLYSPAELLAVREALGAITSAFLLRAEDAGRLAPRDRLIDNYRAAYPVKGWADALEFETLWREMHERLGVPEAELTNLTSMTVGEVVEVWRRWRGAA